MATQTQDTVQVSKLISAPIARVYKAWTEPTQFNKWFGCAKVASVNIEHDFRVGGAYRIETQQCDSTECKAVHGTYQEIVPNKKLVFTWNNESKEFPAKDTLVSVEFVDKGSSTEVKIKHTRFVADEVAGAHNKGWTECLVNLSDFLAKN